MIQRGLAWLVEEKGQGVSTGFGCKDTVERETEAYPYLGISDISQRVQQ